MKPVAWRLVVTAVLFLGWIGYLAYLALMTRNSIVLSRPQFLASELDVIATRQDDDTFLIQEVLWPTQRKEEWDGKTVVVENLGQCQTFSKGGWQTMPPPAGQRLIMPLQTAATTEPKPKVDVVPIPPSPGFPQADPRHAGPPRIYPADAAVLSQYHSIPKP